MRTAHQIDTRPKPGTIRRTTVHSAKPIRHATSCTPSQDRMKPTTRGSEQGMNGHENLKPLGKGHLTPEQEHEIRVKGGKAQQRKLAEKRTAQELLSLLLSSEIKDKALLKQIQSFGMNGNTVDLALLVATTKNTMRKGTISDALDAFTAAGRAENSTDEAAHASLLHALTADDDEDGEE